MRYKALNTKKDSLILHLVPCWYEQCSSLKMTNHHKLVETIPLAEVLLLEKLWSWHIKGDNYSDACLVTFSFRSLPGIRSLANFFVRSLKDLSADFLLWINESICCLSCWLSQSKRVNDSWTNNCVHSDWCGTLAPYQHLTRQLYNYSQ